MQPPPAARPGGEAICAVCADRIGVYEPLWVERPDGTLESTSLANGARIALARAWHSACLPTAA